MSPSIISFGAGSLRGYGYAATARVLIGGFIDVILSAESGATYNPLITYYPLSTGSVIGLGAAYKAGYTGLVSFTQIISADGSTVQSSSYLTYGPTANYTEWFRAFEDSSGNIYLNGMYGDSSGHQLGVWGKYNNTLTMQWVSYDTTTANNSVTTIICGVSNSTFWNMGYTNGSTNALLIGINATNGTLSSTARFSYTNGDLPASQSGKVNPADGNIYATFSNINGTSSWAIAKINTTNLAISDYGISGLVWNTDFSMTVSETTPSAGVIVGGQYNSLQYGFLGLLSTSMTFTWQTGFSGSSKPVFRSSASDSSNSIYAMWVLTGTNNYILTKHNSAGALQWQQQMTVTGLVAGWSFTFDVYGKSNAVGSNIFVTLTINTNTLSTNNFPYLLAIPISKIPISQSFTFGNNYTLTFSPGTLTVQTPTLSTVSTGIMFNAGTDSNPVISTSGISSVSVNNTLTNTLI